MHCIVLKDRNIERLEEENLSHFSSTLAHLSCCFSSYTLAHLNCCFWYENVMLCASKIICESISMRARCTTKIQSVEALCHYNPETPLFLVETAVITHTYITLHIKQYLIQIKIINEVS